MSQLCRTSVSGSTLAILYIRTKEQKYIRCVILQATKSAQFQPQNVPQSFGDQPEHQTIFFWYLEAGTVHFLLLAQ